MDCGTNQCCAFSSYKTVSSRCVNLVTNGSNHCDIHRPRATKLYLKYKKLSDVVDKLQIDKPFKNIKDRVNHLMRCYVLLNKTYSARSRHRKYAFVPECYDEGHDYQFTKLNNLIDDCEQSLSRLYDTSILEEYNTAVSHESSLDSNEEDIPNVAHRSISDSLMIYTQKRKEIEADIDEWMDKYAEDNQAILHKRFILIDNIARIIFAMFNPYDLEDATEFAFAKCVMLFNLTRKLHSLGYLSNNSSGIPMEKFIPRKCQHCDCNGYEATDLALVCSCIYHATTIQKYFNLSSEESLKQFLGVLLYNKAKISAVVEDIKALYLVHRDHVMFMKLYLVWDPLKSRLTIVQNLNTFQMKPSKIAAIGRLRNKFYQQKVNHINSITI